MPNKFVVADPHVGHRGVCTFLAPNKIDKLRPWDTPEEMDEALVELWNKEVNPDDEVDVLGDVCINRKALATIGRLNGKKRLIKGNHDVFRVDEYMQYFTNIVACRELKDMILTHIPIHPCSVDRFGVNVHGHLHAYEVDDPRYFCVSMERIGFKPISLEDLRVKIKQRQELYLNRTQ